MNGTIDTSVLPKKDNGKIDWKNLEVRDDFYLYKGGEC